MILGRYASADVSVIIPAFNVIEPLKRLITSLESQHSNPGQFQTIIVDDGSVDGTRDWLLQYVGPLTLDPVILLNNKGRGAARNAGLAKAVRPIILLLDADVIIPADLVIGHAARHDGSRSAYVGGVRYAKQFGANGYTQYLETRGVFRFREGEQLPPRYFLSGHASLLRSDLESAGGFDESISYGEDIDLGCRLGVMGVKIFGIPSLSVVHQHIRSISDVAILTEEFGHSSLPRLCFRHDHLRRDLKLDLLETPGLRRRLIRLLFSKYLFKFVLRLATIFAGFRLPHQIYSYILFRSYAIGYLRAQEEAIRENLV